jgi:hypothetical protein
MGIKSTTSGDKSRQKEIFSRICLTGLKLSDHDDKEKVSDLLWFKSLKAKINR